MTGHAKNPFKTATAFRSPILSALDDGGNSSQNRLSCLEESPYPASCIRLHITPASLSLEPLIASSIESNSPHVLKGREP